MRGFASDEDGLFKMKRWVGLFDALLVVAAAWFVLPPVIAGHEVRLPLPFGGSLSGALTLRNVVFFLVALFIRIHLRVPGRQGERSGPAGQATGSVVTRFLSGLSPSMQAALIGIAVALVCLSASQPRAWPSGDTVPAKLVPISLLDEGNMDLDEFRAGLNPGRMYGLYLSGSHAWSAYPPGTALTALPLYGAFRLLFPAEFASWRHAYAVPEGDDLPNVANLMEQLSAAAIVGLTAIGVWLFCLRVTGHVAASLWYTLAVSFGTSLLSTAGLALWQHGPACLFLVLMLYLLLLTSDRCRSERLLLAGLCAGWAYVCRPTVAVGIAVMSLWVLREHRWKALWFLVPCAGLVVAIAGWNAHVYGTWRGGYVQNAATFSSFDARVLLTHLFSPSRGLFVFSPFLLFAAWGGARLAAKQPLGLAAFCLYAALATLALFTAWSTWAGGSSFGPRYLCEAAVLLALVLPFAWPALPPRRWARELFVWAVLFSCALHVVGARNGDRGWTGTVFGGEDLPTLWKWRDSQAAWTFLGAPEAPR